MTNRSTDEEVIRWTKSHDVFDRLETGVSEGVEDHSDLDEALREAIFQDNTAQLNMRLPPAMKAVLMTKTPAGFIASTEVFETQLAALINAEQPVRFEF